MARPRRTEEDRRRDAIVKLSERLLPLIDEVSRLACPRCGSRSFGMEFVAGSGIRMACSGFFPGSEDGECGFFYVDQMTEPLELPKMTVNEVEENAVEERPVRGEVNARTESIQKEH